MTIWFCRILFWGFRENFEQPFQRLKLFLNRSTRESVSFHTALVCPLLSKMLPPVSSSLPSCGGSEDCAEVGPGGVGSCVGGAWAFRCNALTIGSWRSSSGPNTSLIRSRNGSTCACISTLARDDAETAATNELVHGTPPAPLRIKSTAAGSAREDCRPWL